MSADANAIAQPGDTVYASLNGTGQPRRGVVTGQLDYGADTPRARYYVHFDGEHGQTGPCIVTSILLPRWAE